MAQKMKVVFYGVKFLFEWNKFLFSDIFSFSHIVPKHIFSSVS